MKILNNDKMGQGGALNINDQMSKTHQHHIKNVPRILAFKDRMNKDTEAVSLETQFVHGDIHDQKLGSKELVRRRRGEH